MPNNRIVRVAVAQFETGKDTDRVLSDMLRYIDEAADGGARLVHFQENCNYPTSYESREEAWEHSITVPGPMVDAISAKARERGVYVGFNASVRAEFPDAYMVNHLIGPNGEYIGSNKKQVLMWIERDFFIPSDEENAVFDTDIGRIGLLSCMDGLVPETSRTLACQGADIVLNSLCSNALDEARLHIPARAAENGFYMIASNRVGDMVKGQDLEDLMAAAGMTREFVSGAGESQVAGPDGITLVRASLDKSEIVFADVDLDRSASQRADRIGRRRPDCYTLLTAPNETLADLHAGRPDAGSVAISTIVPAPADFATMLADAITLIRQAPAGLAVLPELFAWKVGDIAAGDNLAQQVESAIEEISKVAAEKDTAVVAGIPALTEQGPVNRAILFDRGGVVGEYRQIHRDPALGWTSLGDDLPVFEMPFGRLGLLLGEDLLFPEATRVLARKGVDVIACPATWQTAWHHELMLPARAAESHVTIIGVGRTDSPVPAAPAIAATPGEYRFPQTKEVNNPDRYGPATTTGVYTVEIDLAPNRDKRLMGSTDLIADTVPALYGRLVEAQATVTP